MSEPFFTPWIGRNYKAKKTLIISESTYNWLDDEGQVVTPQSSHAQGSIEWNIENFGKNRYFTSLNRTLCRTRMPTAEQIRRAWSEYAYTIFVQEPVGQGAGKRPASENWQKAGPHFLSLLEKIHPLKVIVTGRDMWGRMPEFYARLLDDLQAYRLSNGALVWCLELPHPANRREGFKWEKIGESVHFFTSTNFPTS